MKYLEKKLWGFPDGLVVKKPPAMKETQIQSLILEDSTCHGATKLMHHHHWACGLEPERCNYWARMPESPSRWEAPQHNWKAAPILRTTEKPVQQWELSTAKNKQILKYNYSFKLCDSDYMALLKSLSLQIWI